MSPMTTDFAAALIRSRHDDLRNSYAGALRRRRKS
jgi:hypothetical protein